MYFRRILLFTCMGTLFSLAAFGQSGPFQPLSSSSDDSPSVASEPKFSVDAFPAGTFDEDASTETTAQDSEHHGFASRMVRRGLEDQKELYLAPFKPSNFKWDALVLGGMAGLLIADRHIENHLPDGHQRFYQDSSDIAIGALGAVLAVDWLHGIKTDDPHAKETGELELETLINTFLIYTPMQLIAGRQRPGEGNGHGDFLRHHAMNTSFPGGHAMFAWAMATVALHEYHKPWEQLLIYSAALTVTAGRFLGRDHWSSDMFVGTALGVGIGTHIFYAHCDPELTESCKHKHNKVEYREDQKRADSR
jgi:PAP2 superfamily